MLVPAFVASAPVVSGNRFAVARRSDDFCIAGAYAFGNFFAGHLISEQFVDGVVCKGEDVKSLLFSSCTRERRNGAIVALAVPLAVG